MADAEVSSPPGTPLHSPPGLTFSPTPGTEKSGYFAPGTPSVSIQGDGILSSEPGLADTPTKGPKKVDEHSLRGRELLDPNDIPEDHLINNRNTARALRFEKIGKTKASDDASDNHATSENTNSSFPISINFNDISREERTKSACSGPAVPDLVHEKKAEPKESSRRPYIKVEEVEPEDLSTFPASKALPEESSRPSYIKDEEVEPEHPSTFPPSKAERKESFTSFEAKVEANYTSTIPEVKVEANESSTSPEVKVEHDTKTTPKDSPRPPEVKVEVDDSSIPLSAIKKLFPLSLKNETPLANKLLVIVQELIQSEALLQAKSQPLKPEPGENLGPTVMTKEEQSIAVTKDIKWPHKKISGIFSDETVERLIEKPQKCIASTQMNLHPQCKRNSREPHMVGSLLTELCQLTAPCEMSSTLDCARKFVQAATCLTHGKMATLELDTWQLWFVPECNVDGKESNVQVSKAELAFIKRWAGISTAGDPFERQDDGSILVAKDMKREVRASVYIEKLLSADKSKKATVTATCTTREQTVVSLSQQVSTSHHLHYNFEKYPWTEKKARLSAAQLVEQYLRAPLTKGDLERSGFIYVFWHVGNFNYVKIGYAKNVRSRLNEWRLRCHVPGVQELLQPDLKYHVLPVPHLHRLERLIFSELKEHRLQEPRCDGCKKTHIEWFEVSQRHALSVVRKWVDWMRDRKPYHNGALKPTITAEEIEILCNLTVDEGELMMQAQAAGSAKWKWQAARSGPGGSIMSLARRRRGGKPGLSLPWRPRFSV